MYGTYISTSSQQCHYIILVVLSVQLMDVNSPLVQQAPRNYRVEGVGKEFLTWDLTNFMRPWKLLDQTPWDLAIFMLLLMGLASLARRERYEAHMLY